MVPLAIGANGMERSPELPPTVTTFNAIEATSLLTLCPSELSLVPAVDRSRLRALGTPLGVAGRGYR